MTMRTSGPDLANIQRVQKRVSQIRERIFPSADGKKGGERTFTEVLNKIEKKERTFSGKIGRNTNNTVNLNGKDPVDLEDLIIRKSEKYGVDADLVRAVIKMESGGNPKAVSSAGAQGLMQLMPSTAEMLGVKDPFDPEQNVDGGIRYLRDMLQRYGGNERLGLAAYHSGPSRVDGYGGVPPHPAVTHYVKTVQAIVGRTRTNKY
jgi:soluble lytic murein transglycosylase-like protein